MINTGSRATRSRIHPEKNISHSVQLIEIHAFAFGTNCLPATLLKINLPALKLTESRSFR